MNDIVNTFIELVKIDSPSSFEEEVKKYVYKLFKKEKIELNEDREGNMYAFIDGDGEPIVVCAHLDTVEPGRGIEPVVENGKIKSLGKTILGADNKAAVAAIINSVKNRKDNRPIELIFTVREETDGGINGFDFSILKSKMGIIADTGAPLGTIITQAPYICDFDLIIRGKATHSSEPHLGVNALSLAADVITKLKVGMVDDNTTLNIGIIKGGDAINTVPRKVILKGEMRGFKKSILDSELERLVRVCNEVVDGTGATFEYKLRPFCSGYELSTQENVIKKIIREMNKLNIEANFEISFGGSDANVFIENNINVINLGDGVKDPHTTNESVKIKDLKKLGDLFEAYISAN